MLSRSLIYILLFLPILMVGQDATNIYHLTISKVGGSYRLKDPLFLTSFNKSGYNNQPSFWGDKEIFFSTDYYESEQKEIAKFNLFDKTLTRITYTPESEYSPQRIPGKDEFSVVRVEEDGETQTFSFYPSDGIGYAKRFLNNTSNLGYYIWMDDESIAAFLVDEPDHNLAISHVQSERRKIILDKIGRCLKVDKKGRLLFVHKQTSTEWWLKAYDKQSNKSEIITETLKGSEDFELLNDGTILMGNGSKLYMLKKGTKDWVELEDFATIGINDISRIVSRKNELVLVGTSR